MGRYLTVTRTHSYSLLFALPLLVLYEVGAIYIAQTEGTAFRNGADVLLRTVLLLGGVEGTLSVSLILIAVAAALIVLERRRRTVPLRLTPFAGMAAESFVYASLLGIVVGTVTHWLVQGIDVHLSTTTFESLSLIEGLVLSVGAGLYEEIVFRVLLVGGIFGVFRASGLPAGQAGVFSVVLASLVFSAFHYVGPYGDPWAIPSFVFRFLAGLVFSVLFLLRGFGITAWTHALYDILIVVALRMS
jgi:hypothetical protein